MDRPIFLNDHEDHSDQDKECFENSSDEITASNPNQEKEKLQDSDIRQLIEECSIEICEEQKQKMEDTMLELIEIFRQKELYCMHDNVEDLIESALNSKLLSINSNCQRLDNKEQKVKNIVEQPVKRKIHIESHTILSTKKPKYSPSMGYEHSNTTPETESDEIIKSGVEELVPILSENEIFSDFKNNDDILSDEESFEDIEYIEASLFDLEILSIEEENDVEDDEVDLEDISQIQDIVIREKLLSVTRLISNIESLNDNPIPDLVLNSSVSIPIFKESGNSLSDTFSPKFAIIRKRRKVNDIADDSSNYPLLEEVDLFLFDNLIPSGIENVANDSKGDIRFFEALLINDSILSHESSDSNFEDNPLVPLPPLEPPDADFELDFGNEISVVMNDKFECLRDEFDDNDYYFFMFVNVFSFLSAESEDTIFDPSISA
nr:hypothetical protein [Tanacetum cinerariifolium]